MVIELTPEEESKIRNTLSKAFEELLKEYGDSPKLRLFVVNYTVGYMGASYGLHIPG